MNYWVVKSEPESYSFTQFQKDKTTAWTGVRNFQSRNNLKAMAKGDQVFFYHSVSDKALVGTATVAKTAYPDPTVEEGEKGEWVCVDLKAGKPLPQPVPLDVIKSKPAFKDILLVRNSRISVSPLTAKEAAALRQLGGL